MKFAMSYSCGKDSTLALHKMIGLCHEPVCLVVMVNEAVGRSYFHGADRSMLGRYSEALGIPMVLCPATSGNYARAFEAGLEEAGRMGAETVCFGDIDIEGNRRWEEERSSAAGLGSSFPLWQRSRKEIVREIVEAGYECIIKSVDTRLLPESLLGRRLDEEIIGAMEAAGVDICGENGEYHTLAVNGPAFRKPLSFRIGEILNFGDYSAIDIF